MQTPRMGCGEIVPRVSMADVSALSKRVTNENSLDEPKDKAHSAFASWVVSCTLVTLFKLYNVLILAYVVARQRPLQRFRLLQIRRCILCRGPSIPELTANLCLL